MQYIDDFEAFIEFNRLFSSNVTADDYAQVSEEFENNYQREADRYVGDEDISHEQLTDHIDSLNTIAGELSVDITHGISRLVEWAEELARREDVIAELQDEHPTYHTASTGHAESDSDIDAVFRAPLD